MMNRDRLRLALEHLRSENWKLFEEFASEFLAGEYPSLRSVGGPNDGGRDAELFSPAGMPKVVLQYSVSADWSGKILRTAKRLQEKESQAVIVVFVSNQDIGAKADQRRAELLKDFALHLDIRDQSWFLDRRNSESAQESASERLARIIVDPLLDSTEIYRNAGTAISQIEARTALLMLALQREDDSSEKGLTKLSFDALVLSVLRSTNSSKRKARQDIHSAVGSMLSGHDPRRLEQLTNSALRRLTKSRVRHWNQVDEFCLTHEEATRMRDRLAEGAALDEDVSSEIERRIQARSGKVIDGTRLARLRISVRRVVEQFLWNQGEAFADSVRLKQTMPVSRDGLREVSTFVLSSSETPSALTARETALVEATAFEILTEPSDEVQRRLRGVADAYTLFAFLRHTPDVQRLVSKMFSAGEIWLDTSVLLPVFAEVLLASDSRRFTNLLKAAQEAGLKLKAIPGVVEELERHMNRSVSFSRMPPESWIGSSPFLATAYLASGRGRSGFSPWLERFRGSVEPEDDIVDYLYDSLKIQVESLESEALAAPEDLRYGVQELLHEAHEKRRRKFQGVWDEMVVSRLVKHDVESYVGTIQRRNKEGRASFGYSVWWLTLDTAAHRLSDKLHNRVVGRPPSSPTMSPDFLINFLATGPIRSRLSKNTEAHLPLSADVGLLGQMSMELIRVADKVREGTEGLDEVARRRRVRDELDAERRRLGVVSAAGLDSLVDEIAARADVQDGT